MNHVQKAHNARCGKGGFTLVEISIVFALLGILTVMTVSFSILMNGFAADNSETYDFLEEHDTLKQAIGEWVEENDESGSVFSVNSDGILCLNENGEETLVSFSDGVLSLGEEQDSTLDAIDGVSFSCNDKLIKCVTYRVHENGKVTERSFVFSIRCGRIDVTNAGE